MSKEIVRTGYDAVADRYVATRRLHDKERSLLQDFAGRLPAGAAVLDTGCGAGVPVTQWLGQRFHVTGVDISEEQIRLARRLVPQATFRREDMTALDLPDGIFDGICSFYAVIHIPRNEHRPLLASFHRLLKDRGLLLICMGAGDLPDDVEDFLGAPMYWSHYDAETNLRMTQEAGFEVLRSELVPDCLDPEGVANHLFLLAQKREAGAR
ncbi:MAG TPA: methyltransferase domain-containing protein [Chloroflexota bacterium]|nr:methyltransferase domain-containing protein [Chloroflexota bacterium]